RALKRFASSGQERDRWRAVLGLVSRSANDIDYAPLIRASRDRFLAGHVVFALRELHARGAFGGLSAAVREEIVVGLRAHSDRIDDLSARWIRNGQEETIPFIQELGIIGEQTRAAIEAALAGQVLRS